MSRRNDFFVGSATNKENFKGFLGRPWQGNSSLRNNRTISAPACRGLGHTKIGLAVWDRLKVGRGWVRHTTKSTSRKKGQRTSLRRTGTATIVENHGTNPAIYTNTAGGAAEQGPAQGWFNLAVRVKCLHIQQIGPMLPQERFDIIFGFQNVQTYIRLSANAVTKMWKLERYCAGSPPKCIVSAQDPSLKAKVWYALLLQVRGNQCSIDANGTPIFTSIRLPVVARGSVGICSIASKMLLKGWQLKSNVSTRTAYHPSSGKTLADVEHVRERLGVSEEGDDAPASADTSAGFAHGRLRRAPFTGDDPNLIRTIEQDIVDRSKSKPGKKHVSFDDIGALSTAKQLLNEAVVLPLLVPEFFVGLRSPWKGVLLFGPPGTGKTLLAHAVSNIADVTFFNCSAASLVSKWRGESEKLVRCLFKMARHYAPSIIFIDEVDALISARGGGTEHEASRRLKTLFLTEMDGIHSAGTGEHVMVLATTNAPWDLDEALRRRFEKRIFIGMPNVAARLQILQLCTATVQMEREVSIPELAQLTQGYSGADLHVLCREASMAPMRRLLKQYDPRQMKRLREECSDQLASAKVSHKDFLLAIKATRPSVQASEITRYSHWESKFGSA